MGRREDVPALTGIRGVAALGVVAFHYWFANWVSVDTISGAACARGYIFVDLFFLLSGYVMASSYGWMFAGRFAASDYRRFIAIRLARIYPVYVAVLAVFVALALVHPLHSADTSAGPLLANVTLTQAWFDIPSTVGPAWSLSTEWAVYLLFPLFVAALLTSRPMTAAAVCSGAAASLVALWFYNVAEGSAPVHALDRASELLTPMLRCFVGFALGVGVFRLKDSARVGFARSDIAGVAILLVTGGLWLIRSTPDIVVYACLPPLLLCLALNRGLLAALFGNPAVRAVGEWSYSIYLIHMLLLRERERLYDLFSKHLPSPVADALGAAVLFSVVIAVSAALYTLIEVPARLRLRAMIGARSRPIELEPAAP